MNCECLKSAVARESVKTYPSKNQWNLEPGCFGRAVGIVDRDARPGYKCFRILRTASVLGRGEFDDWPKGFGGVFGRSEFCWNVHALLLGILLAEKLGYDT